MKIKPFEDTKDLSGFINVVMEIKRSIDGFVKQCLGNNSPKVQKEKKEVKNGEKSLVSRNFIKEGRSY